MRVFFPALVIFVCLVSATWGFSRGITRQIATLLGFAFACVAVKVLSPEFVSYFNVSNPAYTPELNEISGQILCAAVIYTIVYCAFWLLAPLLKAAMSVVAVGMFNRILGAFFALLKNLIWISFALNLLLCFSGNPALLNYQRADDGNIVAASMAVAPWFTGSPGAYTFQHYFQLMEAKSISCNFKAPNNVISNKG